MNDRDYVIDDDEVEAATAALVKAVRVAIEKDVAEDAANALSGDVTYLTSLFQEQDGLWVGLVGVDEVDDSLTPLTITVKTLNGEMIFSADAIGWLISELISDDEPQEALARIDLAIHALNSGLDRLRAAREARCATQPPPP